MIYLEHQGFGDKYILNPEKNVIVIGRSANCDIVFGSCYVSRKHCEIQRIPPHGTLLIKNCTSTNPLYVDSLKLLKDALVELRVGSHIGLGVPLSLAGDQHSKNKKYIFLKVCQEEEQIFCPEKDYRVDACQIASVGTNTSHENINKEAKSCEENKNGPALANDDDIWIIEDELDEDKFHPKAETSLFPELPDGSLTPSSTHSRDGRLFPEHTEVLPTRLSNSVKQLLSTKFPNSKPLNLNEQIPFRTNEQPYLSVVSEQASTTLEKQPSEIQLRLSEISNSQNSKFSQNILDKNKGIRSFSSGTYIKNKTNFTTQEISKQELSSPQKLSPVRVSPIVVGQNRISKIVSDGHTNTLIATLPAVITFSGENPTLSKASSTNSALMKENKFELCFNFAVDLEKQMELETTPALSSGNNNLEETLMKEVDTADATPSSLNRKFSHKSRASEASSSGLLAHGDNLNFFKDTKDTNYRLIDLTDCEDLNEVQDQILQASNVIPNSEKSNYNKISGEELKVDLPLQKDMGNIYDDLSAYSFSIHESPPLVEKSAKRKRPQRFIDASDVINNYSYCKHPARHTQSCSNNDADRYKTFSHTIRTDVKLRKCEVRLITLSDGELERFKVCKGGQEEQNRSQYSDSPFVRKNRCINKKLKFRSKKVKKRPLSPSDSESDSDTLAAERKQLVKEPGATSFIKNDIIFSSSDSDHSCNTIGNSVKAHTGKLDTSKVTGIAVGIQFHDLSESDKRPAFDLNRAKEKNVQKDMPEKFSQRPVIIKREPNLEEVRPSSSTARVSRKTWLGSGSSAESDVSDTDQNVIYSQIDEVILRSSDDEETTTLKNLSMDNLSFGPLPFELHEDSVAALPEGEEEDLPDLLVDINSNKSCDSSNNDIADRTRTGTMLLEESNGRLLGQIDHLEKSSDNEAWWPNLSQEFFKEDTTESTEKNGEKKLANSSPVRDLHNIVNKINSRYLTKSKLIEPKLPPPRTKSDHLRKKRMRKLENQIDDKFPQLSYAISQFYSNSSIVEDKKNKKAGDGKKNEQDEIVSGKSKSGQLIKHSTSSIPHKSSSINIRKTLLKTHNLEMYKSNREKPKHHVGRCFAKRDDRKSRQNENLSVQPKGKGPSAELKKGVAKINTVTRSQKLTEVDIFRPVNQTGSRKSVWSFKIPKKTKNPASHRPQNEIFNEDQTLAPAVDINATEEEMPINVDKKKMLTVDNQLPKSILNENSSNEKMITGEIMDVKKVTADNQLQKSILKLHPRQSANRNQHVLFDESNLVSTKLIPRREAKDCLGPQIVNFKERYIRNFPQNTNIIRDHHEFIYRVCKWNYDWLVTYQIEKAENKHCVPPPVCSTLVLPTLTLYNSFDDYKNKFSTLMYYEVWEHIFKDWEKYVKINTWFTCQIDTNKITCIENRRFSVIKAFGLITDEWSLRRKHPAIGSLIVMKYIKHSKTGYAFGYIKSVVKRKAQCIPEQLKKISHVGANTVILFEILFSKAYIEQEIVPATFVSVSNVSYIRPSVRTFECLCNLYLSPLCPAILDPRDLNVFQNEDYHGDYLIHQITLNEAQRSAVAKVSNQCFRSQYDPKLSLIHGPPGTGKTLVISALVSQIIFLFKKSESSSSHRRILLCAPSNAAVDELVIKLAELTKFNINLNIVRVGVKQNHHPRVKEFSLISKVNREFQKKLIPEDRSVKLELENKRRYIEQAVKEYERAQELKEPSEEIERKKSRMITLLRSRDDFEKSSKIQLNPSERKELHLECQKKVLMEAEVIATTLTSCLSGCFFEVFGNTASSFACCIVDEAGQCKETETWFPLRLGIRSLVLVGDHQQLPATVLSQLSQGKKLRQSLFERLYHHIGIERQRLDLIHCLDTQYRMHEAIAAWPTRHFYRNCLITPADVTKNRTHALHPYLIFDVMNGGEERKGGGEIFNLSEVKLIRSLIEATELHLAKLSIGILTPYQQQKIVLLDKLDYLIKKHNITVSTVDSFQGQEKDVVFCSFVRSNLSARIGFVSDRQRLNVSLTRARKSCFVICDVLSLQSSDDWKSLITDARQRNVIRKIHTGLIEDKRALLEMTLVR